MTMSDAQPNDTISMSDLRTADYDYVGPRRGDIRPGLIVSMRPNEIVINLGAKQDAIVASREVQDMPPEALHALKVGDTVNVCVLRVDDREDLIIVSLKIGREYLDWQHAQELLDSGEIVTAKVIQFNKGGVVVAFGTLQGFVPTSQIADLERRTLGSPQPEALARFVGEEFYLKVIEVNRGRRRLILSERLASRERRAQQREALLAEIRVGETRTGTVSSLRDFGAFVDLGGMEGLVHLSELSWSRVKDPHEVLKVGQQVQVQVLRVDQTEQRIALSLKRTQADPWSLASEKYVPGQLAEGMVTHLAKFGAFVELEPGVEGLVHLSELGEGRIEDPAEAVTEGEHHAFLVLAVDKERHRISLSLRQAPKPEAEEEAPPAPPA
jgi:small subunit ribosomal protein S1